VGKCRRSARLGFGDTLRYDVVVPGGNALQLAIEFARLASDLKADDVVALDLRGITSVTDFTVIATGASDRQLRAIADAAMEYGRKIGEKPYGVDGYENAIWIVVDFVDVVLHVFAKPYREYYDLELLWGDAPRLQWARSESA